MSETFLLKISEQLLEENKKLKGTQAAKYNQGRKAGIRQERERIVELLDSLDIQFTNLEDPDYIVGDALDLIELIKGEQND